MKLPPVHMPVAEWAPVVRERWTVLVEKVARMKAANGKSDAFEAMLARLRDMASTGCFDGLPELLKRRLTARALTWLWLNDEAMGRRLLSSRLLSVLVDAQQPRLTRITLQQLAQFYFRRFDKLDEHDGLRKQLEQILLQQLHLLPEPKVSGPQADPLVTLKRDGHWLLPPDGPIQLVERVRDSGHELGETFEVMGLQGFDDGRYGDICRAHFYLETLRGLSPGEYDPVLDELQKPAVSKAPYEGERRIGHIALEILIDRAGQEPGEIWQNFILNLAGIRGSQVPQPTTVSGGNHLVRRVFRRCVVGCLRKTFGCSCRRLSNMAWSRERKISCVCSRRANCSWRDCSRSA